MVDIWADWVASGDFSQQIGRASITYIFDRECGNLRNIGRMDESSCITAE